LYQMRNIYTRR